VCLLHLQFSNELRAPNNNQQKPRTTTDHHRHFPVLFFRSMLKNQTVQGLQILSDRQQTLRMLTPYGQSMQAYEKMHAMPTIPKVSTFNLQQFQQSTYQLPIKSN